MAASGTIKVHLTTNETNQLNLEEREKQMNEQWTKIALV